MNAGGTLDIDLAESGYDRLIVTSPGLIDQTQADTPTNLAGTLDVDLLGGFTPDAGDLFFILVQQLSSTNTGGAIGNVQGTFAGFSDGSTFISDGIEFEISYFGDLGTNSFTGGNDVVIRAVPEPSSSLLALGAAGLILARRRRRAARIA